MLIVGEKSEQISCMCLSIGDDNEDMVNSFRIFFKFFILMDNFNSFGLVILLMVSFVCGA